MLRHITMKYFVFLILGFFYKKILSFQTCPLLTSLLLPWAGTQSCFCFRGVVEVGDPSTFKPLFGLFDLENSTVDIEPRLFPSSPVLSFPFLPKILGVFSIDKNLPFAFDAFEVSSLHDLELVEHLQFVHSETFVELMLFDRVISGLCFHDCDLLADSTLRSMESEK